MKASINIRKIECLKLEKKNLVGLIAILVPLFSPLCRIGPPILKFDSFGPSIIFLNYKNVM